MIEFLPYHRTEAELHSEVALELVAALSSSKPVVLVLGQDYATSKQGLDPLLQSLLGRLKRPDAGTWKDALTSPGMTDGDLEWLSERFERNVHSEALDQVFDIGWSAVFTSSIDQRVMSRIESRGRLPEAILSKDHFARVPRSRARPGVHYLFGRANERDPEFRPPRSRLELRQRISIHANQLLNRIAETATPLGLVVIEGYRIGSDWLDLDELLAPLSSALGLRILWFGAPTIVSDSAADFLLHMEQQGTLSRESSSLADSLSDIQAAWDGANLSSLFHTGEGTVSLAEGRFLELTPSLRLRVEAAAAVVDDTWTDPPAWIPSTDEAESFRRFHGDFGGPRSLVEGIGRGFAITRTFERQLLAATELALRNPGSLESFIVLHGQSGVGKSIALARLAKTLRDKVKIPVLFAWGRVPFPTELDEFCEESEKAGAIGTVVICDANSSFERFRELTSGLKSRGRRIVVVGSSYKIEDHKLTSDRRFVDAPPTISKEESADLSELLRQFVGIDSQTLPLYEAGEHVLALLYRYLTASRSRLAGGVSSEARFAEGTIRLRAKSVPRTAKPKSLLSEKLIAAGLGKESSPVFEEDDAGAATGVDAAGRLIDYVMIAGRLDCPVPINLVIRALRGLQSDFDPTQIAYLFGELDLFRWKMADSEGNDLLVQPRLQLEAELICRRRMADPVRELDCLVELIGAVRATSVDRRSELLFLLDLLHKLHRDGPRQNAYRSGYLRIARALTTLRETHHVRDSSLMLQESAFRREALLIHKIANSSESQIDDVTRDVILNEAREVVELALREIADGNLRAGRKTRQNFAVERASIYGFLAVGLARRGADEGQIWPNYLAARTAISKAMSAADNYFPLDIGIWTPADIIEVTNLSPEHLAELRADIFSTIDQASNDLLPALASEKFHARRMKVAAVLGDSELGDAAYSDLEKTSPAVAYFLKARAICPEIFVDVNAVEAFDATTRSKAGAAAKFLEAGRRHIEADTRCLQLLLQLKWISETGFRLFRRERCVIPNVTDFQVGILEVVSALNAAGGEGARNSHRLLEATLTWILGDIVQARDQFKSLGRDTEFEDSSRVVRRLVLEGPRDRGFRGRLERTKSVGHWIVSVGGFAGTVDLLARDFMMEDLARGREIERFDIAFNYLGPIADPMPRHGGQT